MVRYWESATPMNRTHHTCILMRVSVFMPARHSSSWSLLSPIRTLLFYAAGLSVSGHKPRLCSASAELQRRTAAALWRGDKNRGTGTRVARKK
jgi:hypothetical protein